MAQLNMIEKCKKRWLNSRLRRVIFGVPNKNYWFKRRRYGWGWTPVTWQGWVTVASALLLIVANSLMLEKLILSTSVIVLFGINTIAVIVALVLISYAKGPAPKWRWGKKSHDTPSEDI